MFVLKNTPPPRNAGLTLREKIIQLDPLGQVLFMPSIICLVSPDKVDFKQRRFLIQIFRSWLYSGAAINTHGQIGASSSFSACLECSFSASSESKCATKTTRQPLPPESFLRGPLPALCGSPFATRGMPPYADPRDPANVVKSSMFVFVYYLPIWFQAIKGASAVHSGVMNASHLVQSNFFRADSLAASTGVESRRRQHFHRHQRLEARVLHALHDCLERCRVRGRRDAHHLPRQHGSSGLDRLPGAARIWSWIGHAGKHFRRCCT